MTKLVSASDPVSFESPHSSSRLFTFCCCCWILLYSLRELRRLVTNPSPPTISPSTFSRGFPIKRAFNVLGWAAVALFFEQHVYSVATVSGRSMQPTLNPDSSHMIKDIVLLNRYVALAASHGDRSGYKPGDVVAVKSPINPSTLLIKRLVALPNSLVTTLPPYPEKTLRVPQGHCWIEGDEQFHSRDSNTFGPVPLGCVESRVDWILWPLSRFGPVKSKPGWEKRVYQPPTSSSDPTRNSNSTSRGSRTSDNYFA